MEENFDLDSSAELDDQPTQDRKSLSEGARDNESAETEEGDLRSTDADADDDSLEEPYTLDESEDAFDSEDDDEFDTDRFDEDDEDDFYDDEDEDEETPERARSKRPQRRNLIDRFAEQNGFRKDSDDRYFHGNGSWIAKNKDGIGFQWEQRRSNGSIVKFYHLRDHCLEKKPLEVDTDVFGLLRNHPDLYSLVMVDSDDAPIELTGERIDEMRRDGMLSLLPATYRIVRIG